MFPAYDLDIVIAHAYADAVSPRILNGRREGARTN